MSPSDLSTSIITSLMDEALLEARRAGDANEVPIGAVIARLDGTIIAKACNQIETAGRATAHAEILAIEAASKELKNWRLSDCILCVTLEPCVMCLGAIRWARIPYLVYGAGDSRQGGITLAPQIASDSTLGPALTVISDIRNEECRLLIQEFFKGRRKSTRNT